MISLKSLIFENPDMWNKWINSMVLTIEDYMMEDDQSVIDVYTAYDYLKSDFRAQSPSRDMFEKAVKETIEILKQKGKIK